MIGIQEIGNKEALGYIVHELNQPTIPSIKDWPNRSQGKWTYTVSDVAGRMFQVTELINQCIKSCIISHLLNRDLSILVLSLMNHEESNVKNLPYYPLKVILHVHLSSSYFVFMTNMNLFL